MGTRNGPQAIGIQQFHDINSSRYTVGVIKGRLGKTKNKDRVIIKDSETQKTAQRKEEAQGSKIKRNQNRATGVLLSIIKRKGKGRESKDSRSRISTENLKKKMYMGSKIKGTKCRWEG